MSNLDFLALGGDERRIQPSECVIHSRKGYVDVVITGREKGITIRFISVEQLMMFLTSVMEAGSMSWPDDPLMQYYRKEE